jgi:hypothetical protein
MGYHLETFATWLREEMSLSDDIEILIDRAAIPKDRKERPTTRWDHLAKQQSFSMPKVPSRRRLGDTIEEDTATQSSPLGESGRRLGGDDDDEGAARPGLVKQTSLSSLSRQPSFNSYMVKQTSLRKLPTYSRQTSFNSLTENEQKQMPRLVKQSSFKSLQRGLCDDGQSTGSRPCMNQENSFSSPKRPSRPHLSCVSSGGPESNRLPKLPVRKDSSDETTDALSSMPRLVKQTSSPVGRRSSRGAIIGDDENGGNGTHRRQRMAKQNSFSSPRRPTRTFDSDDETDERTDTLSSLSSMPQLVKQTSFTVAKLSSRGALIGDDEKGGNGTDRRRRMAKQNSFSSPRRPTRTFDSEDEPAEKTHMPRLVEQTSLPISFLGPPFGDDESDGDSNAKSNSDTTPEASTHKSCNNVVSKSTSDLSTSDVDVVIGTKSSSASISFKLPTRQHFRLEHSGRAA